MNSRRTFLGWVVSLPVAAVLPFKFKATPVAPPIPTIDWSTLSRQVDKTSSSFKRLTRITVETTNAAEGLSHALEIMRDPNGYTSIGYIATPEAEQSLLKLVD